jgi:hypothetical protein
LGDFQGDLRQEFCTNIAASVAEILAETLIRFEADFDIEPISCASPTSP